MPGALVGVPSRRGVGGGGRSRWWRWSIGGGPGGRCATGSSLGTAGAARAGRRVARLEEHPAYPRPENEQGRAARGRRRRSVWGLSEKERRDREGVRLPYLDAQNEGGIGEGGRILYDMGVEDVFDDEEDEI